MRFLLTALVLIVFFQNCGGHEFDVSSLPSRPYYTNDMISVADLSFVEGQSAVIVISPKFNLTNTYYFTWEIVPQGGANLADLTEVSGQFELGSGMSPYELPTISIDNFVADGTRRFRIEITLVRGDNDSITSADISLLDND